MSACGEPHRFARQWRANPFGANISTKPSSGIVSTCRESWIDSPSVTTNGACMPDWVNRHPFQKGKVLINGSVRTNLASGKFLQSFSNHNKQNKHENKTNPKQHKKQNTRSRY